jgi:hypothetical protein
MATNTHLNEMTYDEREEEAQRRNASLGSVPAYCLYYADHIPKSRKKCEEWWETFGHPKRSVDPPTYEEAIECNPYSDYDYSDNEYKNWSRPFSDDSDEE